jgi:glutaredoxin
MSTFSSIAIRTALFAVMMAIASVSLAPSPAFAQDAAILRKLRSDALAQSRNGGVVMFSETNCVVCARARAFFDERGIDYVEYDIDESEGNRRVWASFNTKGVPLLLVDGQVMRGFSPAAFETRFKLDPAVPRR